MSGATTGTSRLAAKAVARFGTGLAIMLGMLLLPAGTFNYWQAWTYIGVFFLPAILLLTYLLKNDPALLERRLKGGEQESGQRLIVGLGSACYFLTYLLSGLDQRFTWSDVPVAAVLAGDIVFLASYALFFLVLRENSYASRVVTVEKGQKVVTTGPYAVVRHPMYVAVMGMCLSSPAALGSWWALLAALPMVALLVVRILGEEKLLVAELDGYEEYTRVVRYRLIPGIW